MVCAWNRRRLGFVDEILFWTLATSCSIFQLEENSSPTQAIYIMESNDKIQSPHAALQAMLPRILQTKPEWRPVFEARQLAEAFLQRHETQPGGPDLDLHAVWAIDHSDLGESHVVGWSVTEHLN